MHSNIYARRILLGIAVLCLIVTGTVQAQPKEPKFDGQMAITVGEKKRLQMVSKQAITIIQSSDRDSLVAEKDDVSPSFAILTGLKPGTVLLDLTDVKGAKETHKVVVLSNVDMLRNILRQAAPTANIDVISFGPGVILTGNVARAEDVVIIMRIAETVIGSGNVVSALNVGGVQQVQLDVTVARVDRTKTRQREFTIIVGGTTVSAGSILGGLTVPAGTGGNNTVGAGVGISSGQATALPNASANLILGIAPSNIQMLLQALKTEGLAKLVAEPKLVTQSGRPARFLSGGRQATLSAASGINGPGVTYEEVGTELEFLPIVYGNGKIYLEVAPRVRGVNQGLGVTTTFGTVPGFDEQSIRTSIVLEPGQTFAIGGLIQTNTQSTTKKVPVLGELPFIGSAFSAVSHSEQEQELIILVTPHLVDPMDCNQVPHRLPGRETRSPDDYELYLESLMETPRGQRNVFEGKRYKAAWKNDPTAGEFPCGANGGNGNGYGYGRCGPGNGTTGSCAPAAKSAPVMRPAQTREPSPLPENVSAPLDIPVPPSRR
jgi:pilus assembly protein CpaC